MRANEAPSKEVLLRGERVTDHDDIYELTKRAFAGEEEAKLIVSLRKTRNFIKGLSVVAILEGKLIGHAMLTQAPIVNRGKRFMSLALGPMSVLPEFQRRGFGSMLLEEVLLRAKECGYKAVVVLGHANFYPKFGFIPASQKKIRTRFTVPDENFMILELIPNALKGISGLAEYAREFAAMKKDEPPKKEETVKEDTPKEETPKEETQVVQENPAVIENAEQPEKVSDTRPVNTGDAGREEQPKDN